MPGITFKMYHTTNVYWAKPSDIPAGQPRDDYSVGGRVQTSRNFESTVTIPEGMWALHTGGFGDDLLSRGEQPRNWVGRQRPRCINLGSPGRALYLNHLLVSPEPFAIIYGVPRGWSNRHHRELTLLDIHDDMRLGVRVETARQIHGDQYGKWMEAYGLPTAATEKRPTSRSSFRWVCVRDALGATEMSPERLLLDYWPLVRREAGEELFPRMKMLVADSREQIHNAVVDKSMRRELSLEEMEQLVADDATDWSRYWIPRGFLRDIMLLMQYNWHIPPRSSYRVAA